MKISSQASISRSDDDTVTPAAASKSAGFSLVEVLVTLTVVGLTAMIVIPNLGAGLQSATNHATRQDLARQIVDIRKKAIDDRTSIELAQSSLVSPMTGEDGASLALVFPQGWTYSLDRQIVIGADGDCTGGVIEIARDGAVQGRYVLESGRCELRSR